MDQKNFEMRLTVLEADYVCKKTVIESEIRSIQNLIDDIERECRERVVCQKQNIRKCQDKLDNLKADLLVAKAQLYDKFCETELDESDFHNSEF